MGKVLTLRKGNQGKITLNIVMGQQALFATDENSRKTSYTLVT